MTPATVHRKAKELLDNGKIAARLDELQAAREAEFKAEAKRQGLAPEDIIREQSHTAFFDPAMLFDQEGRMLALDKMPETARRAVKSVKIRGVQTDDDSVKGVIAEVVLNDKLRALHDLGDALGMYRTVHEHHWIEELARMSDEELERELALAEAELAAAVAERARQLDS